LRVLIALSLSHTCLLLTLTVPSALTQVGLNVEISTLASLVVVVALLGGGVAASLLLPPPSKSD